MKNATASNAKGGKTQYWFLPKFGFLHNYQRQWLVADVVAGLSVCVVMIPSVIAYAGLMGLPPQHGLYAALLPLLIYPFFGSSRQVIVGPDIAISLLVASAIGPLAEGNPAHAAQLAALLAGLCALFLVIGARIHIGAVAEFLSKPVLIGYMTGAALILMASQLDKLFGVKLTRPDFFPRLMELLSKLPETQGLTLISGLALLGLLIVLRRLAPKVPPALAVVVIALAASALFDLPRQGMAIVGMFPQGLPGFVVPRADWREVQILLPAAVGIALLTYTEGILLARAFAARHGYEVEANQELTALGLADLGAALFQGFAVTGSQARTTINDTAGGKTQLAGLVAAVGLIFFLLFLTPLIARLPTVALAAILIYGGFTLVEFGVMVRLYRFYPGSSLLAAVTTLGVLVAGVVPGILIGVALSLLALINRLSNPPDAVLSEVPGHGYHDLGNPAATPTIPGLIAYRYYAPLLFSNCTHFLQRVRHLVLTSSGPVRWLLLDAQAITDIDVTAAEMLHGLHAELRQQGIALKIAHANPPLRAILERTGQAREIGDDSFFDSVHECVEAFQQPKGRTAQG